MASTTSYVCTITAAQAEHLRALMQERGWTFDQMPYARWRGRLAGLRAGTHWQGQGSQQG